MPARGEGASAGAGGALQCHELVSSTWMSEKYLLRTMYMYNVHIHNLHMFASCRICMQLSMSTLQI